MKSVFISLVFFLFVGIGQSKAQAGCPDFDDLFSVLYCTNGSNCDDCTWYYTGAGLGGSAPGSIQVKVILPSGTTSYTLTIGNTLTSVYLPANATICLSWFNGFGYIDCCYTIDDWC